ncbi:hypothetical protein BOSEA31B_14557 [Hyphomicrobiales bacterium]|nr:hypothetical protein BOSEA31B_14557 [Hyphomicrobiales bacterium]CAH1701052.1 hypothetical protein BOSEA1005_20751 [Hyphomicrobiales bacterium]CAI0344111.1 hypothetical protein BO1005MUT1_310140 [Hyphomicrobiales bacterium]
MLAAHILINFVTNFSNYFCLNHHYC